MTIFWTETPLDDPTVPTRAAFGFDPDQAVGPIYTRQWSRDRTLIGHETLKVYMSLWGPDHRAVSWSYARWDNNGAMIPNTDWDEGPDVLKVTADFDPERQIGFLTPEDTPTLNFMGLCPGWAWDMNDVAEYRGLANAASARRWIANTEYPIEVIDRDIDSGAKRVNGKDVILAARSMAGRGKGGGRPATPR